MKSRIVILVGGDRKNAVEYLRKNGSDLIDIIAVITPIPTEKNSRFLSVIDYVKSENVPYKSIKPQDLFSVLKGMEYDILVSVGWTHIITEECIRLSQYAINVHPTLLPQYRGFRSGPYILINGEKQSGVTVHFIEKELDRGNIIEQESFPINSFDTPMSLKRKTSSIEGHVLLNAISKLRAGYKDFIAQDESRASQYDEIRTPKDSIIDWNKPLKELYNSIRACDPDNYPAFFWVDGEKVCIRLWRPDKPEDESDMI